MRYAEISDSGAVVNVYDDRYTDVPSGCVPLTDEQAEQLRGHIFGFSFFKLEDTELVEDEEAVAAALARRAPSGELQQLREQVQELTSEVSRLKNEQAALRAQVPPQAT